MYNPNFIQDKILPCLVNSSTDDMIFVRHGSIYGIGDILIGLSGKSHIHNMNDVMKDSVFLRSFTKNDKKLMKAGEYLSKFLL